MPALATDGYYIYATVVTVLVFIYPKQVNIDISSMILYNIPTTDFLPYHDFDRSIFSFFIVKYFYPVKTLQPNVASHVKRPSCSTVTPRLAWKPDTSPPQGSEHPRLASREARGWGHAAQCPQAPRRQRETPLAHEGVPVVVTANDVARHAESGWGRSGEGPSEGKEGEPWADRPLLQPPPLGPLPPSAHMMWGWPPLSTTGMSYPHSPGSPHQRWGRERYAHTKSVHRACTQ